MDLDWPDSVHNNLSEETSNPAI